jgi:hypothetical protein
MFADGKCYADIAFETRIPASTLRAWSAREAWNQRLTIERDQPQLDAKTAITLARRAAEPADIPHDLPSQQTQYQENMRHAAIVFSAAVKDMPAHEMIQRADKLHKGDQTARKALLIENSPPPCVIQIALLSAPVERRLAPVSGSHD